MKTVLQYVSLSIGLLFSFSVPECSIAQSSSNISTTQYVNGFETEEFQNPGDDLRVDAEAFMTASGPGDYFFMKITWSTGATSILDGEYHPNDPGEPLRLSGSDSILAPDELEVLATIDVYFLMKTLEHPEGIPVLLKTKTVKFRRAGFFPDPVQEPDA